MNIIRHHKIGVRAKATAKYIAQVNNLPINLDSNLSERKLQL